MENPSTEKEPTKDEVIASINVVVFSINMVAVYDSEKAQELLRHIHAILDSNDGEFVAMTLEEKIKAFIKITTWFQHEELFAEKLEDFYKKLMGSLDMNVDFVKIFLEHVAKKVAEAHRIGKVVTFITKIAPYVVRNIKMRESEKITARKYTMSNLRNDTTRSIYDNLAGCSYYIAEDPMILLKRSEDIQDILINAKTGLDASTVTKIRDILLRDEAKNSNS